MKYMTTLSYFITSRFIHQKMDITNDYFLFFWDKKLDYWFWTKQYLWSKFFALNRPFAIYIWDAFHFGLYKRFLLCFLIFYLVAIIFILVFNFFKFLINTFYYGLLFNFYYSYVHSTHEYFYYANPRGFFNYAIFLKKYVMTMSEKKLREDFLSTLDSIESRQIYNRIWEYISLLEKREATKDYYAEEKWLIQSQISHALSILNSVQNFYRSAGFYTTIWMPKYYFLENYKFYCECSFFYHIILKNLKQLTFTFNENWSKFVIDISALNSLQFHDFLMAINKIKDISNLTYDDMDFFRKTLLDSFSFSNLNLASLKIYYYFFKLFILFNKVSYLSDSLFICSEIILNYSLFVDKVIKTLLNRDAKLKMARFVRGLHAVAAFEGYRNFWKKRLFFPVQNFLNDLLFLFVSRVVKLLKISWFIETFHKWKHAKVLKKYFKKIQKRDFNYFKALFKSWLDSKL